MPTESRPCAHGHQTDGLQDILLGDTEHRPQADVRSHEVSEILVLGDDNEVLTGGEFQDLGIGCGRHANRQHMRRVRKSTAQAIDQTRRQILVEQQSPGHPAVLIRRSRSAAYANTARMSLNVSGGKSATT